MSGRAPTIWVLAGASGAGKSSIGGAAFRAKGGDYFNPDEVSSLLLTQSPEISKDDADSRAWNEGKRLLTRAIAERLDFVFETTLGGTTMMTLLRQAATLGFDVKVWFVGLASADLHIARVKARVGDGGHDVSEAAIRQRYDRSRENLIAILPFLAELRVIDNSEEGDPQRGVAPKPRQLLHLRRGRIEMRCGSESTPEWVKPILSAAAALERP